MHSNSALWYLLPWIPGTQSSKVLLCQMCSPCTTVSGLILMNRLVVRYFCLNCNVQRHWSHGFWYDADNVLHEQIFPWDLHFYTHRSTKFRPSVRPPVRLSVYGQNRVRPVSSTILAGSISYLHILSSNLRKWAASKFGNFGKFNKFSTLTFFCSWLGIQYDSIVWVIMGRPGYSQNAGVLVVLVVSV